MQNPSELTDHLGYRLRQVSNHVSQCFARKLAAEGVSVAEWVLMRLLYDGAAAPSRVAEAMGFTRGAVTKLADRLIARDLVLRAADPQDGRAQTLALTAKGRRLTPKLAALADQNDGECFAHLCDRDRRLLRQILEDTVARLGLDVTPVD
jgi:DNA-binding MarR family transcriptional regulator